MLPPVDAPLLTAARQGDTEKVRQLLAQGAPVNVSDAQGNHALLYAASQGHLAMVQHLLHSGADPGVTSPQLGTPLDAAMRNHHTEIVDLLRALGAPESALQQARGIGNIYANEWAMLVRAPIATVAQAFHQLTGASCWQQDVQGKEVMATEECYLIWQFSGHSWSLIHYLYRDFWQPGGMSDELAAALSRAVQAPVIYYANSDTAGAISYTMFEQGHASESFEYGSDDFDPADPPGDGLADATALDRSPPLHFFSSRRHIDPQEIHDPYDFVATFLRDMDAYVPGWGERARRVRPGQTTRPLHAWRREAFVRVDFVAVR